MFGTGMSGKQPEDLPAPVQELGERYNVSRESLERLATYVELLRSWQSRINLVGPATIPAAWHRHIEDSLQLLRYIPENSGRVIDLGSGAGFPGLVIAIASQLLTDLIESNGKKAAFLREVIRQTGATAKVHQARIEDWTAVHSKLEVKLITSRALAPLPQLLAYSEPFFQSGAIALFHKGQDVDKELAEAHKGWILDAVRHQSVTDPSGSLLEIRTARRRQDV